MSVSVPSATALDVLDRLPAAVSVVAADGRFLHANPAAMALHERLRLPPEDFDVSVLPAAVRPDGSTVGPDDLPVQVTRLTGEELDDVEVGFPDVDGGVRWLSVSTRRLDDVGPPWSVCISFHDVTDALVLRVEHAAQRIRHETVVASLHEGLVVHDLHRRIVAANPHAMEVLGLTAAQLHGRSSTDAAWRAVRPDGTPLAGTEHPGAHVLATGEPQVDQEVGVHTPDGEIRWLRVNSVPLRDAEGVLYGASSTFVDETEAVRARAELAAAHTLFATAFAEAPVGMALVGLDGSRIQVNRTLCELTGYREEELLARTFQEITHPDDLDTDLELLRRLIAGEIPHYAMEKRYLTATGEIRWVALSVSLVRRANGSAEHLVAHVTDIAERRRLQAALQRLADHDPLTGLQNRRRFTEETKHQVDRCRRYGERAALLLLDLDGFKRVNDTRGHQAGDEVLRAVSAAISARLRGSDQLARLGGDEFAVLAPGIDHSQACALARALAEEVRLTALRLHPDGPVVGASVGIAALEGASADEQVALAEADAAMYRAKPTGPTHEQRPPARPTPPRSRTVRVLHGDDSGPHRRLLRQMLRRSPDVLLAGSVERDHVVQEAEALRPDVVLCGDATAELAAALRAAAPGCRVLRATSHRGRDQPSAASLDGAVLWTQPAGAIAHAIREAAGAV